MTSEALRKSTCSPASAAGPTPCVSRAGQMTDLFGPDLAHANRSASPGSAKAKPTPAISGQNFCGSPESAALQKSLESKWQARTAWRGPMGWRETLKRKVIPSGRSFCLVTLSAPRNDASGYILLPTLPSQMQEGGPQMYGGTGAYNLWKRVLGRLPRGSKEMLNLGSWMMGFPLSWLKVFLAISEIPSSRNSQQNLSKQQCE